MEDLKAEAERLVGLAKFKKLTLLTVESRTAGALACALAEAEAEGAGEVFHGGFVVYSKENKSFTVGVPVEVISKHTSAQVAKAMAVGGVERSPADIAMLLRVLQGRSPTTTAIQRGMTA
jgi:nicotinamide mononucleotide (NMN) deamidase PncC